MKSKVCSFTHTHTHLKRKQKRIFNKTRRKIKNTKLSKIGKRKRMSLRKVEKFKQLLESI